MVQPAQRGVVPAALSELSVTELITLLRLGFVPVGLVIGSSVYDTGYQQYFNFSINTTTAPLPNIGQSMHAARALAVGRMREQARELGAEGVVDVRIDAEHHRWKGGQEVARFLAIGTAVAFRQDRAPAGMPPAPSLALADGPFVSGLSAADFAMLLRGGFRPVTLALGNSVWKLRTRVLGALALDNRELDDYTKAYAEAREEAMESMLADINQHHPPGSPDAPVGVVGMKVEERAHGDGSMIEFQAVGTAVARAHPGDPRVLAEPPSPAVVVPLDG